MNMNINRSWLEIANNALSRINSPILETLEQSDISAVLCKQLLPICIGEVLEVRPWRSASKRVLLAALVDSPAFGYENAFQLPADFIRITEIPDLENDQWIREGDKILANTDVLKLIYVATPEESTGLGSFLISAITTRLASKLALSLTSDFSLSSALYQESFASLQMAITEEDAGKKDKMYKTNSWRDAYGNV